jgi:BirA family transcriptional regulator, biotin operon repressor / biotin---[acetyl-CoA-carboxylase] ligase
MSARPFDARRFSELRALRGLSFGAPLVYQAATGSTNDDALAAARTGAPSGSLFVADYQWKGRGRRGKSWSAASGESLLFSILVRPESPGPINAVTLAVGLGVRAALEPYSSEPLRVKWPNDVLAGARKLAGVLCEGQFHGTRLDVLVIGVGINVTEQAFPAELEGGAVSLAMLASGASLLEREPLLLDVLAGIEARVTACLAGGLEALRSEFSERDALLGAHVSVSGAAPVTGVARGIDAEGRLLLETDGVVVPVTSGTVRFV